MRFFLCLLFLACVYGQGYWHGLGGLANSINWVPSVLALGCVIALGSIGSKP